MMCGFELEFGCVWICCGRVRGNWLLVSNLFSIPLSTFC